MPAHFLIESYITRQPRPLLFTYFIYLNKILPHMYHQDIIYCMYNKSLCMSPLLVALVVSWTPLPFQVE